MTFVCTLTRARKAFTLLELMVAFIIMAILSAIAVPSLLGVVNGDQLTADSTSATSIVDAAYYNAESQVGQASPTVTFPITAIEPTTFVPTGANLTYDPTSGSELLGTCGTTPGGYSDCLYNDPTPAILFTFSDGDSIYVSAPQTDGSGTPIVLNATSSSGTEGGGAGTTTTTTPATTTTTAPPTNYAYVTDGYNNLDVVDLDTGALSDTVATGNYPWGVAVTPNGQTAYVANQGDSTLTPVNLTTNTALAPIDISDGDDYANPYDLAVNPSGSEVFVANRSGNTIAVVSTSSNTVTDYITVSGGPSAVAFTPNGNYAYVADYNASTVTVINTATNTVVGSPISVGAQPEGIVVNSAGTKAYVVNYTDGSITVINISDDSTSTITGVGSAYNDDAIAISPDGSTLYVGDDNDNEVVVINTSSDAMTTIPVSGLYPDALALNSSGSDLYVVGYAGVIDDVNTSTNTVTTISGLAGDAEGIAVGSH